jgi:hypothetical protein
VCLVFCHLRDSFCFASSRSALFIFFLEELIILLPAVSLCALVFFLAKRFVLFPAMSFSFVRDFLEYLIILLPTLSLSSLCLLVK